MCSMEDQGEHTGWRRSVTERSQRKRCVPSAARLVRRIMCAQKGDRGLEHLQSRLTAGEPMILVLQGDEVDLLAGAPHCVNHHAALFERYDGVVTPVDHEERHVERVNMFDG